MKILYNPPSLSGLPYIEGIYNNSKVVEMSSTIRSQTVRVSVPLYFLVRYQK